MTLKNQARLEWYLAGGFMGAAVGALIFDGMIFYRHGEVGEQWSTILYLLLALTQLRALRKTKAKIRREEAAQPRARIVRVGTARIGDWGQLQLIDWCFADWRGDPMTIGEDGKPRLCGWPVQELAEIAGRKSEFVNEEEAP